MQAVEIRPDVYWVGVQDPELRTFDIIMRTENGSSYNAYLVRGEKNALIDTVKAKFADEFIERIKAIMPIENIDYLVLQHAEPDHAGAVEKILELNPEMTVVAHPNTVEFLHEILNRDFKYKRVGNGKELDLGGKTLHFISALLLHWPDNIYSYLKEEKILFSGDSFGSHYADERLFDDIIGDSFMHDFAYYYDKIMHPFKKQVYATMTKLEGLEIEMICPAHGPLLRKEPQRYIELYRKWSEPLPAREIPKIVIVYASAYGYTTLLKDKIIETMSRLGDFEIRCYDLESVEYARILADLEDACALLIGSPTINKDAPSVVWDFLSRLSPVVHQQLVAAAFGSYGWSGEAVLNIEKRLLTLRMHVVPGLRVRLKPDGAKLKEAEAFAERLVEAIQEKRKNIPNIFLPIFSDIREGKEEAGTGNMREYVSSDLIVYWYPDKCIHDTNCFVNLPEVFAPEKRPWVNLKGADPVAIMRNIDNCPSGALQYSIPETSSIPAEFTGGKGLRKDYRKQK
ncbi:Flavorubredoxin [Thermosyntropha lipolytica DSM 11003]|uniref:Flavorubredoxin n=1 Tax=Thermosyntropha lipolytica DSM 11003 TaxID=1123382 RepID=A0A1M5MQ97_9FIRM|nr:(4Fe-4S)-binding protein [Thermosyntropha lipolytica]SHG79069.1 Flavorubredoxin [Thermosyntropha lipolytica DSM 11003]